MKKTSMKEKKASHLTLLLSMHLVWGVFSGMQYV